MADFEKPKTPDTETPEQKKEKAQEKAFEKREQVDGGATQLATEKKEAKLRELGAKAQAKGKEISPEAKTQIDSAYSQFERDLKQIDVSLQGKARVEAIYKKYQEFEGAIDSITGTTEGSQSENDAKRLLATEQSEKRHRTILQEFSDKLFETITKREAAAKEAAQKLASETSIQIGKNHPSIARSEGIDKGAKEALSGWPNP